MMVGFGRSEYVRGVVVETRIVVVFEPTSPQRCVMSPSLVIKRPAW